MTWPRCVAAAAAVSLGAVTVPAGAALASPSSGPRVGVIVRAEPGAEPAAESAVHALGGTIERRIGIINGFSAMIAQGAVSHLTPSVGVASVTPDAPLHLASSTYDPTSDPHSAYNVQTEVGTRALWPTADGSGVDVALIDSGVAPVEGLDNPGQVVYGPDLTEEAQNKAVANLDTYGHGTFMAGIIAGRDPGVDPAASVNDTSDFLGVAPGARIVSVKVADAHGVSDVSEVIAGIDWVVQHAHDPGMNIRVLNLSFGTDSNQSYLVDPLAYAAEVAWQKGIVVVVSAGNDGTSLGRLTMPAADPFVIAVGADDMNGQSAAGAATVASFSNRGNGLRNPDIVAPGAHMQSLRDPGSYVDTTYGSTGTIDDRFFRGSGTSEAAAYVSGSVAELLDQRPYLTPDQVKSVLVRSAQAIPGVGPDAQGAGALDMRAAMSTQPSFWAAQTFPRSSGTGSLDASRGSYHVAVRGVTLTGNRDIFGHAFDSAATAQAEAAGSTWSGGSWNGSTWSGSTWSGSTWSGSTWSGSTWSGSTWSGLDWTGSTWLSDDWSNGTWNGSTWSGSTWSGSTWSGLTWSGAKWSGSTWSGETWT